jgi:hypothetical protein
MPADAKTLRRWWGYGTALMIPIARFFLNAWPTAPWALLTVYTFNLIFLDTGSRELKMLETQSFWLMSSALLIMEFYLYPLLLSLWNSGSLRPLDIVIVSFLPGIIFSHDTPTINTHVPESRWAGAGLAALLYKEDVGFPTLVQWLACILFTIPSLSNKLIFFDWLVGLLIWWWVDFAPAYSLGLHFLMNLVMKPWIAHTKRDSGPTIVLTNQRRAFIWYMVTLLNLDLLHPFEYVTSSVSVAFQFIVPSTTAGRAIVATLLLFFPSIFMITHRKTISDIVSIISIGMY